MMTTRIDASSLESEQRAWRQGAMVVPVVTLDEATMQRRIAEADVAMRRVIAGSSVGRGLAALKTPEGQRVLRRGGLP